MVKERKINWDAAFEIPSEPEKFMGPGGGKRYKIELSALILHAGKEKEIKVYFESKGKDEASRRAWQQTLLETIHFIQSNLKKPLTLNEANQIGDKFADLFREESLKVDKKGRQ